MSVAALKRVDPTAGLWLDLGGRSFAFRRWFCLGLEYFNLAGSLQDLGFLFAIDQPTAALVHGKATNTAGLDCIITGFLDGHRVILLTRTLGKTTTMSTPYRGPSSIPHRQQ